MVIRRVGVASAAKIAGAVYAVIGVFVGCLMAAISLINLGAFADGANNGMPSWIAPMWGIGAVIVLPILYGVMGLVVGALTAVVYNVVSGMAGGLEIEVQ